MDCIVLRQFPGPGNKMFQAGERVDTSEWNNREALIQGRYLQPAFMSSGFERSAPKTKAPEPSARRIPKKQKKLLRTVKDEDEEE